MKKSSFVLLMFSFTCLSLSADAEWDALFGETPSGKAETRARSEAMAYNDQMKQAPVSSDEMPMDNNYPGRGKENMVYAGGPNAINGIHLELFGDFLYWDSGMSQVMNYQYFGFLYDGGGNIVQLLRNLYTNKTKFDPGFRIGIRHGFAAQGWDLMADWIWLKNSKQKVRTLAGIQPRTFSPVWENSNTIYWPLDLPNTIATNTWNLTYNQADVVLGKEIFFSKYFSLKPNMGGRYINSSSSFGVNIDDYSNSTFSPLYNHITMANKLSIGGFVFGLENKFFLGCGFSVMGSMNAGLAYGSNQVTYTSEYYRRIIDGGAATTISSVNNMTSRDLTPLIDARMDVSWERSLFGGKQALAITVGYDYKALVGAFTTMAFPTVVNYNFSEDPTADYDLPVIDHTTLYLQGLNVGIKYSF